MTALEVSEQITRLRRVFNDILQVSDLARLRSTVQKLEQQAADPELWQNQERAQQITSELSRCKTKLEKLNFVAARLDDAVVSLELAAEHETAPDSAQLVTEAATELQELEQLIGELEAQTLLNGKYDEYPAVMTIRAGAGGVDAADFAEMLQRMYLRYAEKKGYLTRIMDVSYAEEAGIKSCTIEFDEPYAFGTLSVESGTHRLVRMSPFNSAGKRQTSFAAVEVIPLLPEASTVEIPDSEIRVDVYRSSGPGGQSVNTTDSAVRITHLPTGIVVAMQNEKSQLQNRAAALRVLQSRLLILQREAEAAKKKELAGEITAAWGDQMRSYVLAPYQMVKDLRTQHEVNTPQAVFDGALDGFLAAGIRWRSLRQNAGV
ncbi:peptide chain release factor 2 [Canibacter sp. lx-45]|uniref:peptide chain release factor 2 n=1 Tax=Canibacter zhuwentaonis TaxID=2837491 RepID=UPI001BDBB5ED|nr:peptide chain release factor 2 [Canibacter zhuwentaonis]MBT1034816.1 peptide chain release factor 2 [Canibacter zhuwentaonis]